MKHTEFEVIFTNGTYEAQSVIVWAFNEGDALILAKAERIKAGCDHTVSGIEYDCE